MDGKGWQVGESESTTPRVSFVLLRLKRCEKIGLGHSPPARLHIFATKVLGRCWLDSASWISLQAWLEHFLFPQQSQRANSFCISSDGGTVSVLIWFRLCWLVSAEAKRRIKLNHQNDYCESHCFESWLCLLLCPSLNVMNGWCDKLLWFQI